MTATLTPWHEEVGRRIREHREAKGWRRTDLVIAIHQAYGRGPSQDVIEQLEGGKKRFVDVPTIQQIADALGVSFDDLAPEVKDYIDLDGGSDTGRYLQATVSDLTLAAAA